MVKKETETNEDIELLISIRNLMILQLWALKVPILDIRKAAKMNTNDIYKIVPKKNRNTIKSNQEEI